jgi:hypothetical protein
LGTLFLTKSLGAFVIALLTLLALLFLPQRFQALFAASIVAIVLMYPALRYADLVPTDRIVSLAQSISAERAGSLTYRLDNEDILLAKAKERPLLGWGGWGRSFVHNEEGQVISVTDGYWVIIFGVGGWLRYIAEFGLLSVAALLFVLRPRLYHPAPVTVALSLVLAANMLDLIPNATLTPVTWLLAGALAGRLELARSAALETTPIAPEVAGSLQRPTIAYSRSEIPRNVAALAPPAAGEAQDLIDRRAVRLTRFPLKQRRDT